MICQTCFGAGLVTVDNAGRIRPWFIAAFRQIACPDCHGGYQHCCEGDCSQPEPPPAAAAYTISSDGQAITCNSCGLTSHSRNDVLNRYCGRCHVFHDDDIWPGKAEAIASYEAATREQR